MIKINLKECLNHCQPQPQEPKSNQNIKIYCDLNHACHNKIENMNPWLLARQNKNSLASICTLKSQNVMSTHTHIENTPHIEGSLLLIDSQGQYKLQYICPITIEMLRAFTAHLQTGVLRWGMKPMHCLL